MADENLSSKAVALQVKRIFGHLLSPALCNSF